MTLSICCLDNQEKWCTILLVSCFDTGQGNDGCVPWIEPLSRGAGGFFQMCTVRTHSFAQNWPRPHLSLRVGLKVISYIKLNELTSYFMMCTKGIKQRVLLVGIWINKLLERGSSVGRELSMCCQACEALVTTVSAMRMGMCRFDWPVIFTFCSWTSWLSSGTVQCDIQACKEYGLMKNF